MKSSFNPFAMAVNVKKLKQAENSWISKQKALCWKCQKDVSRSLGKFSLLIPNKGKRLNADNNMMKFICFGCKSGENNQ